jgi:coenzyme Q-binding protein COQ10
VKPKEALKMTMMKRSIFIEAPLEKVFEFFRNTEHFDCWYAGMSAPENVVDIDVSKVEFAAPEPGKERVIMDKSENIRGDGGVGTTADFHYSIMGKTIPVTLEVTEESLSAEGGVWKANIKGVIPAEQKSIFLPKDNGTEVIFELEQSSPEGTTEYLFLKVRENGLAQALENLKIFCEFHYKV